MVIATYLTPPIQHSLVTNPTFPSRNSFCLILGSSEADLRLPDWSEHSTALSTVIGPQAVTWSMSGQWKENLGSLAELPGEECCFFMEVTELVEYNPGTISGYLWGFLGIAYLRMKATPKKAEPRVINTYLMVVFEGLHPATFEARYYPWAFQDMS